jgi:uncharacterized protein YqeY
MSLRERLEERLKTALKAGRKADVATLRLTLSDVKNAEKEKRGVLDDREMTALLRSAVKKRSEAIELFRKGDRQDLVDRETAEVRLLEEFLPAPLSDGEVASLIDEAITETGASAPRDMGAVMKWLMPRLEGRADGSAVSRLVKARLAQAH